MNPEEFSVKDFKRVVALAMARLPTEFQPYVAQIMFVLKRRPSRKLRKELELADDEDLFGLYDGLPLTEQHAGDAPDTPPRIILFYEPLLDACDTENELIHEIQTTVLHEIGHHFGLNEDDLERRGFG